MVALCGLLSLTVSSLRESVSMVVLITGICLLLFNFTSLQEYLAERRVRRSLGAEAQSGGASLPADDSIVESTIKDNELD